MMLVVADTSPVRYLVLAGTVGVLEKMAAAGLIELRVILEQLRQTNFRGDERLFIDALARFENK
jgi:predicted nucleic acid-binding protein